MTGTTDTYEFTITLQGRGATPAAAWADAVARVEVVGLGMHEPIATVKLTKGRRLPLPPSPPASGESGERTEGRWLSSERV